MCSSWSAHRTSVNLSGTLLLNAQARPDNRIYGQRAPSVELSKDFEKLMNARLASPSFGQLPCPGHQLPAASQRGEAGSMEGKLGFTATFLQVCSLIYQFELRESDLTFGGKSEGQAYR